MNELLVEVFDKQENKKYPVNKKRAVYLALLYPSRFEIILQPTRKENEMPAMPAKVEKLQNGTHQLISIEVKTTNGEFGEQEELLCREEETGIMTRVWIAHQSRKKIEEAIQAGFARVINTDTEEWEAVVGARFQAIVVNGKMVAVLPVGR